MEALLVDEIPAGREWQYEPKWDGFRCLAFKDGDHIEIQSRNGQSLSRYFPELVSALRGIKAKKFVLDGEIVIPLDGTFSFDDLLQRIHPAESRVNKLSREYPAKIIVFDLLVSADGKSLVDKPLKERRAVLEKFCKEILGRNPPIELSPATERIERARGWLEITGGTLDGIIAKRLDMTYRSGERTGMQKVKRLRTVDRVVGGFRYASGGALDLCYWAFMTKRGCCTTSALPPAFQRPREKLCCKKVEPLIKPPGFNGTRFLRWRPDKAPTTCSMEQVKPSGRTAAAEILRPS
jgi:ATP-dependent DNA ligase